jgi:hypothetical protein
MALAPADFYAYSRATGTPYPEDPQERAEMAPAVAEFRRNQLKAPQQESNLLATIGAAALGLGALAGGAYGARRLFKAPQGVREAGRKITDLPSAEAVLQRAAEPYKLADTTPPPSKTAIPQATVDLTTIQETQKPAVVKQQVEANDTGADQLTGRVDQQMQRDTDFVKFSRQADVVAERNARLRTAADQIWGFEEELEEAGKRYQAYRAGQSQFRPSVADLTGSLNIKGKDVVFSNQLERTQAALGLTPKAANAQIRDRIMAIASASEEEAARLMDPNVPVSELRTLMGTTKRLNPTMEVRGQGQMGPTDYENFQTKRLAELAGEEVAQKFLEERLGTGATLTGMREVNNPEYTDIMFNEFIPHWDELAEQGALKPRNTTVTAEDVERYGLPPERMHSNMSFFERKNLEQQIDPDYDKGGTGLYLSEFADAIGLSKIPQTIIEGQLGKPLTETLGSKEQSNKGTTFIPGRVQEAEGNVEGSLRQLREIDEAIPVRATRAGEESTGVFATSDPERPFRLVGEGRRERNKITSEDINAQSTRLRGGYEMPEATPFFQTGGNVEVKLDDKGFMTPVVVNERGGRTLITNLNQATNTLGVAGTHKPGEEILRIQPYMMQRTVEEGGQQLTIKQPLYGTLQQRTATGLKPAAVSKAEVQGIASGAAEKWNGSVNNRVDWLAQNEPGYLEEKGYVLAQQQIPGTQRVKNVVVASPLKADPNLGEPYHYTGFIAEQVHTNLKQKGLDLPVLQDPSAKHQFITDVTNVTTERAVYGKNKAKESILIPGRVAQKGLSGIDPMQFEDAGESAGGVAFYTPRVDTISQRKTGDQPEARILPAALESGVGRTQEEVQNTLMMQAANRKEMLEAARLTPGGRINREALGSESDILNKYGVSSAKLMQEANAQMSRSQQFVNQLPQAQRALAEQQQNAVAAQETADAVARHIGNYISAATQRIDDPLSWKGDVKLKGVGQNALRPYTKPSEGMVQALINMSRSRGQL